MEAAICADRQRYLRQLVPFGLPVFDSAGGTFQASKVTACSNYPDPHWLSWVGPILDHEIDVLSLREANRIAEAALKEAENRGAKISVSICDAQGHLVAHQKMDNTSVAASQESIGKAIAAITFRGASGETTQIVEGYGRYGAAGLVQAEGAPLINRKGGLPVFRSGRLIGAIGVSGPSNEEFDEQCARAGLVALDEPT